MTSDQTHKLTDLCGNASVTLDNADLYSKDEYLTKVYQMVQFLFMNSNYKLSNDEVDELYRDLVLEFDWLWFDDMYNDVEKVMKRGTR